MNKRNRIINWIGFSLSLPENRQSEMFYFDKSQNLFFSIHIVDYFMLDENLEIDESATSSYNKKTENEIVSWIKQIEREDKLIISVPQKGLINDSLKRIEAEKFLEGLSVDIDKTQIWEVEEKISVNIDLTKERTNNENKKWWEIWK
ncbi:hypothetical protein [uncultured Lacinutrix sp.]|uniref:hypothetical protein n=1 Tax=uncultured Lacinutrix sp. TaxID=574032 RepID=UPI0026077ACA|nr:hypothetical protein [uncultured Lacinutrix sp.]